ncbi:glycosyltransferase [Prolixibacteraceae bacterium Z1-6]|uniref:Glycosyltransferase n=1 Tax=Draconibacterium aestuarii TaxID=2998507 RepID=A0A9X3F3A9_9BACT|nr:glycosyltransferase [Prolixibacteraceae bacterium Z1-6]
MKKLIYVGFSFSHHGEHTGYDQIRKYVSYEKIINCQKSFNLLQSFLKKRSIATRLYGKVFGGRLWWIEIKLIIISIFNHKGYNFHYIYGENIYRYLGHFKYGNKITLTLHQPPAFYESTNQKKLKKALHRVDKIIVMSKDMESYFKKEFPNIDIKFIPHGVDTKYFKPNTPKHNQILMVGNWLRDFTFASKVFKELENKLQNIQIKIITNKENHKFFIDNKVQCFHSISDNDLLALYQSSKLVFLPLKKFTANNAVLEAQSCGCQVLIATEKENFINEDDSNIRFIENNIEKAFLNISNIVTSWDRTTEERNRKFIRNSLDWKIIGNSTEIFLKN